MASNILIIFTISVMSFTIFGFIDALLSGILFNLNLQGWVEKYGFTLANSDVLVGAFASCFALLISHYTKNYSKRMFNKVIDHPLIDITGIIIGAFLYIVLIRVYLDIKKNI